MRDDGMVEVRESYFKRGDGTVYMTRKIGKHILYEGLAQVSFISWSPEGLPWYYDAFRSSVTAIVKEGPKAMVLHDAGVVSRVAQAAGGTE
jgi:hypothetical protein